jgi:diguanylate cyclase (GGDEF)-like protein
VRDGLTGLLNHTRFKEQINIEITRARRLQQPLSLAMIDIDHFKHVNDTYGHPAGDRVLRLLSRFLERRLRCTDVCGRFGGEEFGVLLTGADAEQAAKVMDALREDFSQLEQTAEQQAFHVTFSCGIADLTAATDATQIIRQADRALYRAKHGGRNQVRIATLFND